ncbi:hypothetical protein TKK_0004427 [Trichogramma kaykai]|uniref:DUF229 domain-containing protein n=1 Tax=Trichogramma kaykai TaxID=54128 RepID=A0ABD2XN49_9HYME
MWKPKCPKISDIFARPQSFVLILLPFILILTLYWITDNEPNYEKIQYLSLHAQNVSSDEIVEGYLVWNPKCHIVSKKPLDPSIIKFVKREKFVKCSTTPALTSVKRSSNGSILLVIDPKMAKNHKNLSCCWAPIIRPCDTYKYAFDKDCDSKFSLGACEDFTDTLIVPGYVDSLSVTCRNSKLKKSPEVKVKGKVKVPKRSSNGVVYENVHAVLSLDRVQDRLNETYHHQRRLGFNDGSTTTNNNNKRPLSLLMLGIDSVSRLNFHRTMLLTKEFFDERGWLELRGYNKMGDNTFPNLMAFLTGQNQTTAYARCKPKTSFGLDNCSMIWYNFRDAGYVTAYGEDHASISTFNYLKLGFVQPPTDYYMRPYILASEKRLKTVNRFNSRYCSGPELAVDRIFDFGVEFAKTFSSTSPTTPYFGFFWTNSISHEYMNGPSAYDAHFLDKLLDMESAGVMNDTMIVALSDHGMRFGDIRGTFVGWYEERLPFIYLWLPEWFRLGNPEEYAALRQNQNRLTSPYDLYETFRDILGRAGGQAGPSSGCPKCTTLFRPVPHVRSCADAGIAPHWCTCTSFKPADPKDKVVIEGAHQFVEHIDDLVKKYKTKKGKRKCAKMRLKRIIRVSEIVDLERDESDKDYLKLFYLLEVMPGGGQFETTIKYYEPGNWTILDEQVSRINLYGHSARCLDEGYKQYCHCI